MKWLDKLIYRLLKVYPDHYPKKIDPKNCIHREEVCRYDDGKCPFGCEYPDVGYVKRPSVEWVKGWLNHEQIAHGLAKEMIDTMRYID